MESKGSRVNANVMKLIISSKNAERVTEKVKISGIVSKERINERVIPSYVSFAYVTCIRDAVNICTNKLDQQMRKI